MAKLIDVYLSAAHRDGLATSCAVTTLAGDVARSNDHRVRSAYARQVGTYLELLARLIAGDKHRARRMKAIAAFVPAAGSATPADGRVRLDGALTRFDQACRARAASGQDVASTIFGAVPVADFARFQELHVRHHIEQIPGAP